MRRNMPRGRSRSMGTAQGAPAPTAPTMSAPMAPSAPSTLTGPISPSPTLPKPAPTMPMPGRYGMNPGGQRLPSQANRNAYAAMSGRTPGMPNANANPMARQQYMARALRNQRVPTSMPAPMPSPITRPGPLQPAPTPTPRPDPFSGYGEPISQPLPMPAGAGWSAPTG